MLFCPLPWIHLAIRNNGDLRVCCQANQGKDKGLLRKEDGSIYNAEYDNLNDSRNSKKLKDIRKAMLNDKWHPDCIRCQREEESGMRSRFSYEEELWTKSLTSDDTKKLTNTDGSIDIKNIPVLYFDLRFGNKCNLKCRTCGPTDSSLWYEDQVKLWGDTYIDTPGEMKIKHINGKYIIENDIYKWYKKEYFWNQLYKYIPDIKHVYMVGGEPLLIKEHYNFLEECISQGFSKNITIEYNTNLVFIPNKVWGLWKHFKSINIGVSIDGIGKINDYIRFPSKWKTIESNLRKLNSAGSNFNVWIAHTVNALNIYNLPDFLKWISDQNFKNIGSVWQPIASLHPLHSPHFLNINLFPKEIKDNIKNKFDNFIFDRHQKEANDLLTFYLNFMLTNDNCKSYPKFLEYNNKLDEIRDQKLKDYIPDLYNLIKEY